MSNATIDNVSWNTSQLEVELLRAREAVIAAQRNPGGGLFEVRTRFDIFFSRVASMSESDLFMSLRNQPSSNALLVSTVAYLDRTVPLIDGPDDALHAALPELEAQLDALKAGVRRIALTGTQLYAAEDTARRGKVSRTLLELAAALFLLILALIVALAILTKLFRRGQRYARAIHAARSRFEAVITSSLDAVVVIGLDGKIVDFNGAGESVFGYTRDEVIGADMAEMIIPDHLRERHRAGMKRYLDSGRSTVIGKRRMRLEGKRKSGEVFPLEVSVSLTEAGGEEVLVSFLRDITQELQAEDQLRRARDKARKSERAKTDLLTVMSHEMRTPLNGILGSLSLIDRSDLSERNKKHLQSIEVSGELLLSHVKDVLDLSSLTVENLRHRRGLFNLRDLITRVSASLQATAEAHGNRLTVNFLTPGLDVVKGHKGALQQCLVNLAGNAIKFTRNGVVSIEVERLRSGDMVEIRVADTGVGIAPENLDRIFEEFVTIDTAFSRDNAGTGLGLAITRRLVEAMGARIDAESEPGEGSLFTIRVSLPEAEMPDSATPSEAEGSAFEIPAGRRALVVDDNEINRMILTDMLSDMGLAACQAADGFAAIKALKARPADILLLDISMPGIDGIETLARIRALPVDWSNLPAVAVTAHASKEDHDRIMSADFNCLLIKPVSPSSVRDAIGCALGLRAPVRHRQQQDPRSDFEQRFGKEKYDRALREMQSDAAALLGAIETAPGLTRDHRQAAHRLAGSAAVLGQQDIWDKLQQLQYLDLEAPPEARTERIAALRKALEILPRIVPEV
ncbi:MAG: PAS domain S-box protein [Paracoccus sp. (in: a-proteobacteria)]